MNIQFIHERLLSDAWRPLREYEYDLPRRQGGVVRQRREVYLRGNGATVLLYNPQRRCVLLIRQFRLPTYLNGNPDGMLIEACAGLLDQDAPEACVRREAMEETGYAIGEVRHLFSAYMSPGGVTEIVHFFCAEYSESLHQGRGGGIDDEDIEVLEIPYQEAWRMVEEGRICDGKTIMLLQHARLTNWFSS
ncbi:GDP-mannose pyrophosphatase NudK [Edwardsiella tarda]|uniref:GDP-mannose pyrophosphatase NudK n=1 Tax=Edwardsiella tarda TaxID=636 RepID=UPI002444CD92|nr:GDP-mannose pyrophosphatase NudK [Edwardsiella tarda]WGE30077.1 GDP-mannose pyrophosphatase NudK [Edwardsiella tarda]